MALESGLLWCSPRLTTTERIAEAIAHYIAKYSRVPNAVHVHPTEMPPEPIDGLLVESDRHVPTGFVWVGIDEKLEGESR